MSRRMLGIAASALVAVSLLAGCAGSSNLTATELTAGTSPASSGSLEVGEGSDTYDFALGLLRESADEKNTLVSPGADELADMLQAYGALAGDGPLRTANSVWLRDSDGLSVEDDFLVTCGERLGAQVFSAPFDDSTVADVNAWVSEKTDEMIPQMLSQISDSAQVLLVNALAFDGGWEDPFDSALVSPDTFTCEDGTEQDVTMMHSAEDSYLESELATGFVKPYEGYDYAFVGLLPAEGVSVEELLASLDGDALEELLTPVAGAAAEIGLPKFTSSYEAELTDALRSLGMTDAFDATRADFSRMGTSEQGPLYVGSVLHKTFVDVNEEGTRAAAATTVSMDGASAPGGPVEYHEVILDRPFVYLIVDLRCDLPVFIGTYMGTE